MFGSDNAQASNDDPAMLDSVKQLADDSTHSTPPPATTTAPQPYQPTTPPVTSPTPTTQPVVGHPEPAPGFSSTPISPTPTPAVPAHQPATPPPAPVTPPTPPVATPTPITSTSAPADTATPEAPANDAEAPAGPVDHQQLAGMKQHALDHLEPLVGHLEQSAEEEFKTTMMMIQSNDNHTLLEKALDAAKRIADDKARAEALLDIVNEINYFASQSASGN